MNVAFERIPSALRVRIYDVDYAHLPLADGGDLFLTRYGWPIRRHLMPEQWYTDRQYATRGKRLAASTGHVYRVQSKLGPRPLDMVIKFSRLAQDVPVSDQQRAIWQDDEPLRAASFNSPFEEFSLLIQLRDARSENEPRRMLTKRPLAIYSPPERYEPWQMGRKSTSFAHLASDLEHHQQHDGDVPDVRLDPTRDYLIVFGWLKGENAEDLVDQGVMSAGEARELTYTVLGDLLEKGFVVLDHKPVHVILRVGEDGRPLRRQGRWVYGLVDFELLKPAGEYVSHLSLDAMPPPFPQI